MRLDVYLCESGMAASRTEAKNFILSGSVTVCGKTISKPSFLIDGNEENIHLDKSSKKFVSRGGLKLEAALDAFSIFVDGALALDVGASSGGFTDCLLKRGAAHVIAVDSGSGQMSDVLRNDARVTVKENFNARFMERKNFEYVPNFAVMDVSFISATYIIPALYSCMAEGGGFVCLIKPQFEVGREKIGKGGIVKDIKARECAVRSVIDFAKGVGFEFVNSITSPVVGGDGNVEYLAYFIRK